MVHNTYAAASIAAADTTKTTAMRTTAHMYLARFFAAEGDPFVTGGRAIEVLTETLGSVTSLGGFSASTPGGVGASCDWATSVGFNRLNSKLLARDP